MIWEEEEGEAESKYDQGTLYKILKEIMKLLCH